MAYHEPLGPTDEETVVAIRRALVPLTGAPDDYSSLLADITPNVCFVLIGESTHGSHNFYSERARITQRLITEGFDGVVLESDYPDTR